MTLAFSDPRMLWLLAAVPLALLLAVLMRREKRVAVASLRPWRAVLALPRPRPHRNPLDIEILCILLATGLAAFALAGPILRNPLREGQRVYIVLDDSVRMQARGADGTTRWDGARAAIRRLQDTHPGAEATLFLTSENRPRAVRERLDGLTLPPHPSGMPPDPIRRRAFLETVLETAAQDGAAVVWISDTAAGVEDVRLESVHVGVPVDNRAILVADWVHADPPTVFLAYANFGGESFAGTLHIAQDGADVLHVPVTLPPDGTEGGTRTLPDGVRRDAPVTIRLLPDADAMPMDNAVTLPPLSTREVRVPDTIPPRLALGLEAAGLLPVREGTGARIEVVQDGAVVGEPDVLLLVEPGRAVHGILSCGTPQRVRVARVRGGTDGSDGSDGVGGAEGLPGMAAEGLTGAEVRAIQRPPGSRVLVEAVTEGGAVEVWMADWEWEGRQVVYIAGLPDSWTGTAAFPVALASVLASHVPSPSPLPGAEGSDTTRSVARVGGEPTLSTGEPPVWEWPLTRVATGLALLMLLVPFFAEYRRVRSRTRVASGHSRNVPV